MKSKSCNFYHTNTKNPGDNPGIFFDPYNTADFEWLPTTQPRRRYDEGSLTPRIHPERFALVLSILRCDSILPLTFP